MVAMKPVLTLFYLNCNMYTFPELFFCQFINVQMDDETASKKHWTFFEKIIYSTRMIN